MTSTSGWPQDYFHRDPAYGLNDWEPVVAFVRALLENAEDKTFCWPNVRPRVLSGNHLLSQTFIQHLGELRDERGIDILIAKLATVGPHNRTLPSPWCSREESWEFICLEALAKIGGPRAKATLERYRSDPARADLALRLEPIRAAAAPRPSAPPCPKDYPEILKGVRSLHDVLGEGGASAQCTREEADRILAALRNLPWYGHVEHFSGDGHTTSFQPRHRIVDHVNDFADRFSDFGIYRSNPKIEYPIGRRRWANSHTYLAFQIPDAALYDHEYTWDLETNTLHTHFHEHVSCEEAVVNPDGLSVTVARKPISTGVEVRGNVFSKRCSSAVRGVWDNPGKEGRNHYTRRANILTGLKKLYYFRPLHQPIVNQLGIWHVDEQERPERFFAADGSCREEAGVIEELLIPLHEPKVLGWTMESYRPDGPNDPFSRRVPPGLRIDLSPVPSPEVLEPLLGVRFEHSHCGTAGAEQGNDNGYRCGYDLNADGIIDQQDQAILARHAEKVYRMNIGDYGYFGFNWLSLGTMPRSGSLIAKAALLVCSYDHGAGYDSDSGIIRLFEPLPPGRKVYVEYFFDAPPAPGKDNVKVYLHRGLESG